MKDFNLKKELSSLNSVKPDVAWKMENREILNCQIQNSLEDKSNIGISEILSKPQRIFQFVSQPAFAVFSIALILFGGGSASLYAANNTKPGDSLYIAKILSEKAQLVMTFDEVKKNKLGLKFANDRALDITQMLASTDFENEGEKEKANKLSNDFRKEIIIVKSKMGNIDQDSIEKENENINSSDDSFQVFSADFIKDGQGIQVSEQPQNNNNEEVVNENEAEDQIIEEEEVVVIEGEDDLSTSTPDNIENIEENIDANKIIEQAEKLFNEQDYDGAYSEYQKVHEIIEGNSNNDDSGEVKGVSESASSTEDSAN